jgi:2-(1,2-epoxy-1,2-dihydrophenyl)acetyl-CoA isomerase
LSANLQASAVLYAVSGGVATITLNRPDVLNALNLELMQELRVAMDSAAQDPAVRAVLFTGAGRGFSAGADLGAGSRAANADSGTLLRERYHPVILRMRTMQKPIVVAVNGVAAGAGMSLAMAGDVILAGRSASFLQAFSKIGLVPDAGSTWFLPRLIGEQRARALMLLAEKISAEQAEKFGLVWQVVADEELQQAAQALANRFANAPTKALGMIKQAIESSHDNTLPAQLEVEATLQSQASRSADFAEGVAAFLAKRAPNFSGQ